MPLVEPKRNARELAEFYKKMSPKSGFRVGYRPSAAKQKQQSEEKDNGKNN